MAETPEEQLHVLLGQRNREVAQLKRELEALTLQAQACDDARAELEAKLTRCEYAYGAELSEGQSAAELRVMLDDGPYEVSAIANRALSDLDSTATAYVDRVKAEAAAEAEKRYRLLQLFTLRFTHEDNDTGCWRWLGSFNSKGYGQVKASFNGAEERWFGHRLAHHLFNGPLTEGMHVMHSCDNRWCVNPDHLSEGTAEDNNADMVAKGRHVAPNRGKTHCVNGHPFSGENLQIDEKTGSRRCVTCARARARRQTERRREERERVRALGPTLDEVAGASRGRLYRTPDETPEGAVMANDMSCLECGSVVALKAALGGRYLCMDPVTCEDRRMRLAATAREEALRVEVARLRTAMVEAFDGSIDEHGMFEVRRALRAALDADPTDNAAWLAERAARAWDEGYAQGLWDRDRGRPNPNEPKANPYPGGGDG